jgi:hypothetical protein
LKSCKEPSEQLSNITSQIFASFKIRERDLATLDHATNQTVRAGLVTDSISQLGWYETRRTWLAKRAHEMNGALATWEADFKKAAAALITNSGGESHIILGLQAIEQIRSPVDHLPEIATLLKQLLDTQANAPEDAPPGWVAEDVGADIKAQIVNVRARVNANRLAHLTRKVSDLGNGDWTAATEILTILANSEANVAVKIRMALDELTRESLAQLAKPFLAAIRISVMVSTNNYPGHGALAGAFEKLQASPVTAPARSVNRPAESTRFDHQPTSGAAASGGSVHYGLESPMSLPTQAEIMATIARKSAAEIHHVQGLVREDAERRAYDASPSGIAAARQKELAVTQKPVATSTPIPTINIVNAKKPLNRALIPNYAPEAKEELVAQTFMNSWNDRARQENLVECGYAISPRGRQLLDS